MIQRSGFFIFGVVRNLLVFNRFRWDEMGLIQ